MNKIFLLDHRSGIFQTFQDVNQLFGFCNRCSRNLRDKTLIITNKNNAKVVVLQNESPIEINALVIKLQNEINK